MDVASHNQPGRRDFFQQTFARILGPVSNFIERRLGVAASRTVLRPPGALPEPDFLNTCARCGACVDSCPADAIVPWDSGDETTEQTPVIFPDVAACVVCDGLECMRACPTGALRLVESGRHIRMGLARVTAALCVRSRGEDCTVCVDRCPLGTSALRWDEFGMPEVLDPGCVGCGVCQLYCPTTPKAIVVDPR